MLSIYVFLVLLIIKYLSFHKYSQTSTNCHLSTTVAFLADSPYIHSCLNLFTTSTFSCLQDGPCREVQLYSESFFLMNSRYNLHSCH